MTSLEEIIKQAETPEIASARIQDQYFLIEKSLIRGLGDYELRIGRPRPKSEDTSGLWKCLRGRVYGEDIPSCHRCGGIDMRKYDEEYED